MNIGERLKILDWIFPEDFRSRHQDIVDKRAPESGTWFLQNDVYQNWVNGITSNLLCYQGIRKLLMKTMANTAIAGAGKTFLT